MVTQELFDWTRRKEGPVPLRPRRFQLQWHLTDRCNLRCRHCYQEAADGRELDHGQLCSVLEQFEQFLSLRARDPGTTMHRARVVVTGGEPFLRTDFREFLEELARRDERMSFAVLTNGTLVDSSVASWLAGLAPEFVQVSIDGTRETHDAIRGPGSFDAAIEGLRGLVRQGIRTSLAFTAHSANAQEFEAVARLGRSLGVTRVWADRLVPCGGGRSQPLLDRAATRRLFESMERARAEARAAWFGRTRVAMDRSLQFLVGGGRPYTCRAGDTLLAVGARGELYPCRRLPLEVGRVPEQSLALLWETSPLLAALRDPERSIAGCEGCLYGKLCRGGLRCLAAAVAGDPFVADPGCWKARRSGGCERPPAWWEQAPTQGKRVLEREESR